MAAQKGRTTIFRDPAKQRQALRERNLPRDSRCREERSKEQVAKPVQWTEGGELVPGLVTAQNNERAEG